MNNKNKLIFLILTLFILIGIGAYPIFYSQSNAQKKSELTGKQKELKPIPMAKEDNDSETYLKRQNKNRYYNFNRGENLELQEDGEIFGRVSEAPPSKPLPLSDSDLIIVGKVTKSQPYLSETKTSIYSEFSILIEDVLKDSSRLAETGSTIVADREGGAVILPNGRILRYSVAGIGALPDENLRYVFFLKNDDAIGNYKILSGYELNRNGIIPLENYDDRKNYAGISESGFLMEVKNKISTKR